ncbi:MAG: PAS domain S-box protein [Candidatus Zixiibacteriota bacterium]
MKYRTQIIAWVICCAAGSWVIYALADYFIFYSGIGFWDLLIFNVPTHELYIRTVAFIVILILGLSIERIYQKWYGAEKRLLEQEQWHSMTLKSIGDAVIATNNNGKITFLNIIAANLTGWDEKEAIGRKLEEVFTIVDKFTGEKAVNPIERILKEGIIVRLANHTELISKDGDKYPIVDSGAPIKDNQGNLIGTVLVFNDISERRSVERVICTERDRAQQYLDLAGVILLSIDTNQNITLINKKGCEVLGYDSEDELLGKNWFDCCLPAAIREQVKGVFNQLIADNLEPIEFYTNSVITKSGEERMIAWHNTLIRNESGEIIASLSSGEDITERVKAEDELKTSEERFRAIFESANDAIYIKNRDLVYTNINSATKRIFNCKAQDFIGKPNQALFDIENEHKSDKKVFAGHIVNEEISVAIGGKTRSFHNIKVPMRDNAGTIYGICGIAREITETKILQELTERTQRLETAGRIAGQVAHDFNNLLGPLMAYPELMKEELPDDHPLIQYIEDIEKSARQIADINMQLLTLGQRGYYNQELLNVNDIIRQIIKQQPMELETIKFSAELEEGLMNIKGGASQIYRIISNLMTNATDSIKNGGELVVRTENYYVDTKTGSYGGISKGEYVKITIRDSGCGISPDIIANIFDPFFTTKATDKTRGSGLGLSVVHAVMSDHNGFIDLESELGKGSSFYLYFPATRESISREPEQDEVVGGKESILVVDDDTVQREVIKVILNRLGYKVYTVESGEMALDILGNESYDLLLLDMIMPPGIDGVETYRGALKINPFQKAIVISGYAKSERVQEALKLGVGAFVRKPMTMRVLATAVRAELDKVGVDDGKA